MASPYDFSSLQSVLNVRSGTSANLHTDLWNCMLAVFGLRAQNLLDPALV